MILDVYMAGIQNSSPKGCIKIVQLHFKSWFHMFVKKRAAAY